MERLGEAVRSQFTTQGLAPSTAPPSVDLSRLGDAAERGELPSWLRTLLTTGPTQLEGRPGAPVSSMPASGVVIAATGETPSPREVDVLRLLMGGLSNRQVAEVLAISPHTVKHHVASVFQKLAVTTHTQAVVAGTALGLSPLTSRPSSR